MTTVTSTREQFCSILSTGPLLRGDAIVVLAGEDGEARLATAIGLLHGAGAPVIVVSGGLHTPPSRVGAPALAEILMGKGVAPSRILVESASQNTREQAVNVVDLAMQNEWRRLLLVASPYHSPRAFLTFIQALHDVGKEEVMQLVNVPAAEMPWWKSPIGVEASRVDLLASEFDKIDAYQQTGDVASYEDGLTYIAYWEGR